MANNNKDITTLRTALWGNANRDAIDELVYYGELLKWAALGPEKPVAYTKLVGPTICES